LLAGQLRCRGLHDGQLREGPGQPICLRGAQRVEVGRACGDARAVQAVGVFIDGGCRDVRCARDVGGLAAFLAGKPRQLCRLGRGGSGRIDVAVDGVGGDRRAGGGGPDRYLDGAVPVAVLIGLIQPWPYPDGGGSGDWARPGRIGAQLAGVLGEQGGAVGGWNQSGAAPLALQLVQVLRVDALGQLVDLATHRCVQVVQHRSARTQRAAVGPARSPCGCRPGCGRARGPKVLLSACNHTPYTAAFMAWAGVRPSPRNWS
jgi:hypothetical protein